MVTYKEEGKIEAANRYQDQINLLEERFNFCHEKLDKLTSPQAIFESRLNRAVAELRSIERQTVILDINSAGSQNVQDQHVHCLKMYRTLSDVKTDIENVIRTGRKLCEEPLTKNPKMLGQRIDTLKHLYNSLGEHVTKSKVALENLMRILNLFNQKIESVVKWISKQKQIKLTNNAMSEQDNIASIPAIDMENELRDCHGLFEEYGKLCDAVYIDDLKEKLNCIDSEFYDLVDGENFKFLKEMKENLGNIDNLPADRLK